MNQVNRLFFFDLEANPPAGGANDFNNCEIILNSNGRVQLLGSILLTINHHKLPFTLNIIERCRFDDSIETSRNYRIGEGSFV